MGVDDVVGGVGVVAAVARVVVAVDTVGCCRSCYFVEMLLVAVAGGWSVVGMAVVVACCLLLFAGLVCLF